MKWTGFPVLCFILCTDLISQYILLDMTWTDPDVSKKVKTENGFKRITVTYLY